MAIPTTIPTAIKRLQHHQMPLPPTLDMQQAADSYMCGFCVCWCCGNIINPAMHSASFDFATLTLIYFMFAVHFRLSKHSQISFALRGASGVFGFATASVVAYATADYSQFLAALCL